MTVVRVSFGRERAYDLYARANELDDDEATESEAEELYYRAVAIDPSFASPYVNLGNLAYKRNQIDRAEVLYRIALSIEPGQAEATYNLGVLRMDAGEWEDAISIFEPITRDPGGAPTQVVADSHYHLASAHDEIGDVASAATHWRAYLKLAPDGEFAERARHFLTGTEPKRPAPRLVKGAKT